MAESNTPTTPERLKPRGSPAWTPYVVPLALYLLVGPLIGLVWDAPWYPAVYVAQMALTALAMTLAWSAYRRFSFRISRWSFLVGAAGGVLWVGLCRLNLEAYILQSIGLASLLEQTRSGFNPFSAFDDKLPQVLFLGVRFLGLVLIVPIIEEFFLRGFFLRWVVEEDFEQVPFGVVTPTVALATVGYGVITHPAEMFAAAAWFSLVTWWMAKTKSIWDCIVVHAVTNCALGAYILASGDWRLW